MTARRAPAQTRSGPAPADDVDPTTELDRLLREDALRTVFQPVVDLVTERPVAVEALVRGPRNSPLATPAHLFGAAARAGRVVDLDRACRRTALRTVAEVGLPAPWTLFLNADPSTGPAALDSHRTPQRAVVELPEKALTARPGELLRLVETVRGRGWGIALDDVGADPAGLALLPLVRPDVIKLDLRLLRGLSGPEIAALVQALSVAAERDGSTVVAEGVETEEQRRTAIGLGATLGQGWLFGRPARLADVLAQGPAPTGALPTPVREPVRPTRPARPVPPRTTPFEQVAATRPVRRADAALVEELLTRLESQVGVCGDPGVLVPLGTPSPGRRQRQADAARSGTVVVPLSAPAATAGADPAAAEFGVAVLGLQLAGVVLARPARAGAGLEVVVSHDRELVTELVTRLVRCNGAVAGSRSAADVPPADSHVRQLVRAVSEAVETDRRVGTGTGLLLVAVDVAGDAAGDAGDAAGDAGDAAGDVVTDRCRAAAVRRMRRAVRSVDRWIPLGTDRFAVLLTGLPRAGSEGVVERVADALLLAVEIAGDDAPPVSVSIGASLAPGRATSGPDALQQATEALHAARRAGGHCARIWPI